MVIKQYQGEIYLVLTLNTNVEEMQQQIEESKEKVHLNTENVFALLKALKDMSHDPCVKEKYHLQQI